MQCFDAQVGNQRVQTLSIIAVNGILKAIRRIRRLCQIQLKQ